MAFRTRILRSSIYSIIKKFLPPCPQIKAKLHVKHLWTILSCVSDDSREPYPNSIDDLRKLAKLSNLIWGSRQNYFAYSKDKESAKNTLRITLIEYFDKTASISLKIVNGLE